MAVQAVPGPRLRQDECTFANNGPIMNRSIFSCYQPSKTRFIDDVTANIGLNIIIMFTSNGFDVSTYYSNIT